MAHMLAHLLARGYLYIFLHICFFFVHFLYSLSVSCLLQAISYITYINYAILFVYMLSYFFLYARTFYNVVCLCRVDSITEQSNPNPGENRGEFKHFIL